MRTNARVSHWSLIAVAVAVAAMPLPPAAEAQDSARSRTRPPRSARMPLFDSTSALELAMVADFRQIRRDRGAAEAPYRPARLHFREGDRTVSVPVRVRPRGVWRRARCDIPPLRLNFAGDSVRGTVFARQDRMRLVMHCRNNDAYETYVAQEYLLYRVHNLITPRSYRTRLARVAYVEASSGDTIARRRAFLLEDDETLAERLGGRAIEAKGAGPADLEPMETALFGVFQYMIGNTDFSVSGLHNVTLLSLDTTNVPVAYDFDFSGAVSAQYATPPPQLPIRHVTQRIMRGYCVPPEYFERAFAVFRERREAIYAIYREAANGLIPKGVADRTLRYFDEFYDVIGDPRRAKRLIIDECLNGAA